MHSGMHIRRGNAQNICQKPPIKHVMHLIPVLRIPLRMSTSFVVIVFSCCFDMWFLVLKCYTGVTFGVQSLLAENPVAVKVYRQFIFNFPCCEKNNFRGKRNILGL